MLLSLSIIGIFLSMILLYFNARKYKTTVYLGVFFLMLSMYGLNQHIILFSESVILVKIIFVNTAFVGYLTGPMLYFYIRSVLTDDSRLRKKDFVHFLPVIAFILAALPYEFTSSSYKTEIAMQIVRDRGFLGLYNATILSAWFSNTIVYLSRPFLVFFYTLWSIGFFIRYLSKRIEVRVLSHQKFMEKWLSVFLGFQLILISSYLFSMFITFTKSSDVFFTLNLIQIISGVGLAGLLISPFFFPGILYGLPHIPEPVTNVNKEEKPDLLSGESKKSTPNFEAIYIIEMQKKADSCMREFQPFLQPDLNLIRFSDIIQLPTHHLAYYFREIKKQAFNDYCNECRVEYAKSLMLEGKTGELTLEAVGILSGFTNRSTFFRAFKKAEDISPGSFLVKMNQKSSPA